MVEMEDACCKRMFVEEEREAIRAQKRGRVVGGGSQRLVVRALGRP